MGYLKEFIVQINNRDLSKFFQLWEEYCTSDTVETEEFMTLLKAIKASDFVRQFGQVIETALPLWQTIQDPEESYTVLRELINLQNTNSPALAEITLNALQKRYGSQPQYTERLRLIGMRNKDNFQAAIANYDLLDHMQVGKFVFHTGGWGTGEIMEVSPVREQVTLEFENVAGRKHMTFSNAFKTLIPLPDEHFLARRFADPDRLEQEAKENPAEVVKVLLRDLGPKTAGEIKDEICELVIPEKEWTKWWQAARAKLKKDTMIESPASLKDSFILRKAELSHEERLMSALEAKSGPENLMQTAYAFVRDFPQVLKNPALKQSLQDKLVGLFDDEDITKPQELQLHLFLEHHFGYCSKEKALNELVHTLEDLPALVEEIEIIALKKRALTLIRDNREDWAQLFLQLFDVIPQSALREYILNELNTSDAKPLLIKRVERLLAHPEENPDLLVWYFQTVVDKDGKSLPYGDKAGQLKCFESFLILFSLIESKPEHRDLTKKIYMMISGKRYALVRELLEGSPIDFIHEFLLLVTKCQTFTDHDLKILRSLAEVAHPSLASMKQNKTQQFVDGHTIWTTEEGFMRTQERIKQLGTTEIVENAREIEAARSLGDLRENSEYKFALEKRSRLQGELKHLSDQLGRARIISKLDIHPGEVFVGSVVTVQDSKGNKITYTLLGPWDADVDKNVLSFQSKLAQAMVGIKEGEKFTFRDEEYMVKKISSIFE